MTTPAAWVEAWRGIPSTCRQMVRSFRTSGSASAISRRAGDPSQAFSSVILGVGGMSRATLSVSAYRIPSARPTSRTAALAASVPKVTIWATWSAPYLRVT